MNERKDDRLTAGLVIGLFGLGIATLTTVYMDAFETFLSVSAVITMLVFTVLAYAILCEETKKNEKKDELNDPALSFGQYLFDKKE